MHLGVSVLLLLSLSFGAVSTVHAQLVVSAPDVVGQQSIMDILKKVATELRDALVSSLSAEMINLLSTMASQLASNTAVWVGSGGNAESPLINVLPSKDYFKYAGARILSDVYNDVVIDNLEDGMWPTLNVYLNTDPSVLAAIRGGIRSFAQRPEISFEYPSIKNNWAGYLATVSASDLSPEIKTAQVLSVMVQAFDPGVNELSAIAQVEMYALNKAQSEARAEEESLQANDGFQAVVHYITGQVETPASQVKKELEYSLELQKQLPFDLNTSLLSNSDSLLSIGVNAGTIFTNTLFSQLMNKFKEGLFEDVSAPGNPFDPNSAVEYSRDRIAQVFRSITSFKPLEITDYSLLSELATCPSTFRGSSRRLFNCGIDSSFASAIALSRTGTTLTLQNAIDEGYVDGNWPLIPSSDTARNQDPKCYTYGFCHSNIVKLRKARIISVGWEIASESDNNSDSSPVTLQEVINGFYSCNSDGELDDQHPWCHLIDPNWVLKFPETQCRTLAYGQLLSAAGTDQRAEECVDIQSCVSEDENGNCAGGYGACVREKNVWQFRGNSCPQEYASCMTFETEQGVKVDFLTNTIDYGDCRASNAGCLWYATQKDEVDDVYDWPVIASVEVADLAIDAYKNRLYFNDEVETCEAEYAGCSTLYERDEDLTLNIFSNPGFEADSNEDGVPDGWLIDGLVYSTDGTKSRTGTDAIDLESAGGTASRLGIVLDQSKFYSMSVYAKSLGTGTDVGTVSLSIVDENGTPTNMSAQSITDDCSGDCLVDCRVLTTDTSTVRLEAEVREVGYTRFECVFTTPTLIDRTLDLYAELTLAGDVSFDDIQIEQSSDPNIFTNGYNQDSFTDVYLKIAPEYLGCTGADSDVAECDLYARMCTEQDAGCGQYIPTNGDPAVSAVISDLDTCPAICDGYDTYRQEATTYESFGDFPIYFIADSADSCNESAVGCTEFTNLETEEKSYFTYLRTCVTEDQAMANTGGDRAATFYTWEGSDEEGYQLRTWRLLESDLDATSYHPYAYASSGEVEMNPGSAPCTNWQTNASGITCEDDSDANLRFDSESSSCDEYIDTITNPDCREFYDIRGSIHYRLWSETTTVDDSCVSYRLTELAGDGATEQAAVCTTAKGYYDAVAGLCRFYGFSNESTECSESDNGCRSYTGGRSANSRVALEEMFEDGSISSWESDSASSVTLSNESVSFGGHSLKSSGQTVWTYQYNEGSTCTNEDGCDSTSGALGGGCTVSFGRQYCGTLNNQLFTDKTYTLTFWAKGAVDVAVGFDINASASVTPEVEQTVELTSEWKYYSIGPFDMNSVDYPSFGAGTVLAFDPDGSGDFYIDNLMLREGEDNITIIRDSWTTPMVCDVTTEGAISPQYQLGCQEYTDQDDSTWYLKSFRDLCSDDKVGCSSYFTTEQSDSEYIAVYNATCYNTDLSGGSWLLADNASARTDCHLYTNDAGTSFDTTSPVLCTIVAGADSCQFDLDGWFIPEYKTLVGSGDQNLYHISYGPDATFVAPDSSLYAIYDENLACSSEGAGCMELGQPEFTPDNSKVDSWQTVYLLNDPDLYDTILCGQDELFCKEWDTQADGTWYFKDPIGHTCEYKTDVTVSGTTYSGWFKNGTSEFCYGTGVCSEGGSTCSTDAQCALADAGECLITQGSYLVGGTDSGIWRNGDTQYSGWVGNCSAEYNGCSEFVDPLDMADSEFYTQADGESYFYIDNDQLSESSLLSSQRCNGQVSQKEGCVLFNDGGEVGFDYNASATYTVSSHADELLGKTPFSLVDPVDCSTTTTSTITLADGSTFDPCASRCAYANPRLYADFDIRTIGPDDFEEFVTFGTSCYQDSDCAPYESDLGDMISGDCVAEYLWTQDTGYSQYSDVTRLENDTNRIIKVEQNRVCSEWLSCSSSYSIWDQDAGRYRTICDGIDLCTEYSAEGHPSFCSAWDSDNAAVVLDAEKYVSRDVSFYGEDYSGYSIPDIFPLQTLEQVNIAPPAGYCDWSHENDSYSSMYDAYHGDPCNTDSDCFSTEILLSSVIEGLCVQEEVEDYRLGFVAGACDEDHAQDCSIGYCSDNGSACTDSGDCETSGAVCTTGVCYAISTTACSSTDQCGDGQECLSGACVTEGNYCAMDYSCGSGETCFVSEAAKQGSCYRSSCFLSMDGQPFDNALYEGQVCRAHPEVNSPFGDSVVSQWKYWNGSILTESNDFSLSDLVESTVGAILPSTRLSGFSQVNLCAKGEDCMCSYTKLSDNTGLTSYIAASTNRKNLDITGICSPASSAPGALCTDDTDCGNITDGCVPIVEENTVYGLTGYCLERDTGLNIEGDQYKGACLTWFPVDQLAGSTDLYAKYATAGYNEDEYYCGYTSMFTDFYTTGSPAVGYEPPESPVTCAETNGSFSCNDFSLGSRYHCTDNAGCPTGYYAVVGQCLPNSEDGDYFDIYAEDFCMETTQADCPYVCVPYGSHNFEDESSCDPETIEDTAEIDGLSLDCSYSANFDFTTDEGNTYSYRNTVCKALGTDYEEFDGLVDYLHSCVLSGMSIEHDDYYDFVYKDYQDESGPGQDGGNANQNQSNAGFLNQYIASFSYPACSVLLQTSAGSSENYAWTDKLLGNKSESIDTLEYIYSSENVPYGASIGPENTDINDYTPARIAVCDNGSELTPRVPYSEECDTEYSDSTTFDNPGALSYIDFNMDVGSGWYSSANPESLTFYTEEGIDNVVSRVDEIFAKVINIWHWDLDTVSHSSTTFTPVFGGYGEVETGELNYTDGKMTTDYTDIDDVRSTGFTPTVWSVDLTHCGTRYCEEGTEGAITLNSQDQGDFQSTDGFFRATLKFFAAAYKEQLPIRRVIVDWGDGDESGSDGDENYYKNHRGLVDGSLTESICTTETEWGMTSDSCDPNYFTYQHAYRCSDASDLDVCLYDTDGQITNFPCQFNESTCAFQPRVHVRDNWGWCTGSCGEDGEGEGCFDGDGDLSGVGPLNHCDYTNPIYDAWVNYDGIIYVEE